MVEAVQRTLDFSGRTSRRAFWSYFALVAAVTVIFTIPQTTEPLAKALLVVIPGMVFLPLFALTARRLHDTGRTGWWSALYALPVIGTLVLLVFCARKPRHAKDWPARPIHRLGQGIVLSIAALYLLRLFWAPYWIPSGSMKPTLLTGDYLIVSLSRGGPEPGDVIVFREAETEYVFRVVAGPGDRVKMQAGKLVLNGAEVATTPQGVFEEPRGPQGPLGLFPMCQSPDPTALCTKDQFLETLPNGRSHRVLDTFAGRLDDTPEVSVPEGHVFVLGDNRDNANDSRVPRAVGGRGFVPIEDVVGVAKLVLFSSRGALVDFTQWRWTRFWEPVV